MKYSDENLMRLIGQISHQYWHGGKNAHEEEYGQGGRYGHGGNHWHDEDHDDDHGHDGKHWHGGENGREEHEHGENFKYGGTDNGRVGYPNCPGPGCGNGCPYKGTEKCPKVAAGKSGGGNPNRSNEQFMKPLNEEEKRTLFTILLKLTGGEAEE